jgi:flagella basal body P-ring formation protein FlgA
METLGPFPTSMRRLLMAGLLALLSSLARADDAPMALDATVERQVRDLALAGSPHVDAQILRVDVQVGRLDPRLRLAPCARVQPYLPAGSRLWGKTRIGLRCTEGASPWNVYLPVTVKVYAQALVAKTPLSAGAVLTEADFIQAEVDLAEDSSMAVKDANAVVGRTLARAINVGQSVRQAHLKVRQWFAAGDTVKVVALGSGFSVAGEGQALTAGIEGQPARVRTESGRVLTGMPSGERRVEMAL